MKRDLFILIYIILMGTFIISVIAFLSRLSIYLVNDNAIPFKELFFISLKIGMVGGVIGGVGTWIMYRFNIR